MRNRGNKNFLVGSVVVVLLLAVWIWSDFNMIIRPGVLKKGRSIVSPSGEFVLIRVEYPYTTSFGHKVNSYRFHILRHNELMYISNVEFDAYRPVYIMWEGTEDVIWADETESGETYCWALEEGNWLKYRPFEEIEFDRASEELYAVISDESKRQYKIPISDYLQDFPLKTFYTPKFLLLNRENKYTQDTMLFYNSEHCVGFSIVPSSE